MVSVRSYSTTPGDPEQEGDSPTRVDPLMINLYTATLGVVGESAAEDASPHSLELDQSLKRLARRLATDPSKKGVAKIGKQVELELREWGKRAALDKRAIADHVKELLIALAHEFKSVDNRNQGYSDRFIGLTDQFGKIANINDLTTIRTSLVEKVEELKSTLDQMKRENQQALEEFRNELSSYESKLLRAEGRALTDPLTGLANRRSIEERLGQSIANGWSVCLAMFDLNRFKPVNDELGHLAGDDLLSQFSKRLSAQIRSGDLAGRWGGDEFVVIMMWCDLSDATVVIERIKREVFGTYRLQTRTALSLVEINIDAAVGIAQWEEGDSVQHLIQKADSLMYAQKRNRNRDLGNTRPDQQIK
jgi:diguanylate cyclase (GGDEF)-like protein